MNIGVLPPERECHVPEGSIVVSIKICETCGNLFVRKDRDRNCRKCHAKFMPLSVDQEIEALEELMHSEYPIPQ